MEETSSWNKGYTRKKLICQIDQVEDRISGLQNRPEKLDHTSKDYGILKEDKMDSRCTTIKRIWIIVLNRGE